ncbi:c-type cytochrome [Methylibium sp.]|uniref:c-type cytochrome n=1 Tax=Methylibium sp. TaxID=2067992 RepID=UPI0025CC16A0|nr:c-type cytochrome [Methylibium sp.]
MSEPPMQPAADAPPTVPPARGREPEGERNAAPSAQPSSSAPWKVVASTLAVLAGVAALIGVVMVYGGLYNVAATAAHLQPTYSVLETAMKRSVRLRARNIEPPPLDEPELLQRGAACFRDHCVQCHGAPGVAPGDFSRSMQPVPVSLIDAARHWRARELYWVTREGIKMSGMPAWEYHLSDREMWAVVAFLTRLPALTPQGYEERMAAADSEQCRVGGADEAVGPALVGNAERGRQAMREYACIACHSIPGVTGAPVHIGPPLGGLAGRQWIAGALPNTTANLVAWLRDPQRIDPETAMPDMGVTAQHAHDMATYLQTLR